MSVRVKGNIQVSNFRRDFPLLDIQEAYCPVSIVARVLYPQGHKKRETF